MDIELKEIPSIFTEGTTILAHLLRCKRFEIGNYAFTFWRLASVPNLLCE